MPQSIYSDTYVGSRPLQVSLCSQWHAETSLPWESLLTKATRGQVGVEANSMENVAVMCIRSSAYMQFAEQTSSQQFSSSTGMSSRIAFQLLSATVTTGSMSIHHHHLQTILHGQKSCLKWVLSKLYSLLTVTDGRWEQSHGMAKSCRCKWWTVQQMVRQRRSHQEFVFFV